MLFNVENYLPQTPEGALAANNPTDLPRSKSPFRGFRSWLLNQISIFYFSQMLHQQRNLLNPHGVSFHE